MKLRPPLLGTKEEVKLRIKLRKRIMEYYALLQKGKTSKALQKILEAAKVAFQLADFLLALKLFDGYQRMG